MIGGRRAPTLTALVRQKADSKKIGLSTFLRLGICIVTHLTYDLLVVPASLVHLGRFRILLMKTMSDSVLRSNWMLK